MPTITAIGNADPDKHLSDKMRQRISKFSRVALLGLWRIARNKSRRRGAIFWREVKLECWQRLAGVK